MSKEKLGQQSAFPMPAYSDPLAGTGQNNTHCQTYGISKRFYAACAAMQGILSSSLANPSQPVHFINIVEDAYKFADELLKQENE
jgi:hypothetical protein